MQTVLLSLIIVVIVAPLILYVATTQPLVRPRAARVPSVSADRLQSHVRMLSETLHPRSIDNLPNLAAAADYVHAEFTAAGARVSDQWFDAQGERYRNVIASF